MNAAQAFLQFQVLSVIPLRTWSMVHTVLSSALLLCVWKETRSDNESQNLQQQIVHRFAAAEENDGPNSSLENSQWLSQRHIRALVSVRNALNKEPLVEHSVPVPVPVPAHVQRAQSGDTAENEGHALHMSSDISTGSTNATHMHVHGQQGISYDHHPYNSGSLHPFNFRYVILFWYDSSSC